MNFTQNKKYYIETYGCQMNVSDSEVVAGLLEKSGFSKTESEKDANIIFLNTCAIREHAEDKIHSRLGRLNKIKKNKPDTIIGILGCMAQHVKDDILENKPYVDFVLGPDSYKRIPKLLERQSILQTSIVDTRLSRYEVYEDLFPSRNNGVNAWVSIMRGCDKFCTFCIVPFTRGRERSRPLDSIVNEVKKAVDMGFIEITLLGQNVNSYNHNNILFPKLIDTVAKISGVKRIRYTSPHPQDIDEELLFVMRDNHNICNSVHLPLQAGSNKILNKMNRTYTKEKFMILSDKIRNILSNSSITTDIIVGFPGESEKDFNETLDVMNYVKFDSAFTFKYSSRPGTKAAEFDNHISEKVKRERLSRLVELQQQHTLYRNKLEIGKKVNVLVEKNSKKSKNKLSGRTENNKWVILPKTNIKIGEIIPVKIIDAKGISLFGETKKKKDENYAII